VGFARKQVLRRKRIKDAYEYRQLQLRLVKERYNDEVERIMGACASQVRAERKHERRILERCKTKFLMLLKRAGRLECCPEGEPTSFVLDDDGNLCACYTEEDSQRNREYVINIDSLISINLGTMRKERASNGCFEKTHKSKKADGDRSERYAYREEQN